MKEKEVGISEYVNLVLRYKYFIILIVLIFTSIGFAFYKYEVPVYKSSTNLILGTESLATDYTIGNVQKIEEITHLARSYPFIYKIVQNLNLTKYPVKNNLIDRFLTEQEHQFYNQREMTFYCLNNVNVKYGRSGIITITVYSQYPNLAKDIANEIGTKLIEENKRVRSDRIEASIKYIDHQLNSLNTLLQKNRKAKEENEATMQYNRILILQDRIESNQNVLALFMREREHLRASIDLNSGPNTTDISQRLKDESKLEYTQKRIEQLIAEIDMDKSELRSIDRTEFYKIKELEFAIDTNENIYTDLIGDKQKIMLASLVNSNDLRFLSKAYRPLTPDKTNGLLLIIVFFGIGLGIAFTIIQLNEILGKKFKSSNDIEERLELKVLGNIPKISKKEEYKLIRPHKFPKAMVVEAYRTLSTNMKFAISGKAIKSILFTSDKPETGKSMTIVNLATIMSDSLAKIIIVDADLRKPTIHKIFNQRRRPGLSDVLAGQATLKEAIVNIKNNLSILPAGKLSYNPQNILESKEMKDLARTLEKRFDFIFYDSIPMNTFSDAAILANETDATLLIMSQTKSNKDTLEFAKRQLDDTKSQIIGIVVNKAKKRYISYPHYYYYYSEHHGTKNIFMRIFRSIKNIRLTFPGLKHAKNKKR